MGTREGVEKVAVGVDHTSATVRQKRLIQKLLNAEPDVENYLEYRDYLQEPCKSNASAFLDAFAERNADRADGIAGLVSYMAERPGVEKLGSHGLFGQSDDRIDLDRVARNQIVEELATDEDIAALYAEWNKINREKLSLYYDKKESDTPLKDNPVFRSIKNVKKSSRNDCRGQGANQGGKRENDRVSEKVTLSKFEVL